MKDHSEKSTQSRFNSQHENKSRRNSICSEYYCWYGHEDCFSEGGMGKYSGGRGHNPKGNRPWRIGDKRNGGSAGSEQYPGWGSGFRYQQGQSKEIKKQHSMKKREEAEELAKEIAENSEIADRAAKIKKVLGSLPSSHTFRPQSYHQSQESQEHQSSEPDRAPAVPTPVKIKLIVPEVTASDHPEVGPGHGKSIVEVTEDLPEESLISSRPFIFSAFRDDQAAPPPSTKTEQDGDNTLDLNVRCEVGGVYNRQHNAGLVVDIVEVPKTLPPCKAIACEEATTSKSSSSIVASGSSYPIDSATRLAPVYKKRGKARIIGGHEVVIGCVGDLVNVQENNVDEFNNENHVEINLEIETSPDESIEQDNLNKMKSFRLIFEKESSLLSDLESVDSKMTSLAQERSSVLRQLFFLSKLKSQMLK